MIASNVLIKKICDIYPYAVLLFDENVICGEKVKNIDSDDYTYWIIDPNNLINNFEPLSKLDNKNKNVWEIPGIWACLIKDKKSNLFRAISSINNELPWYYSTKFPSIISNNLSLFISQTSLIEWDETAIASFVALDWCLGGSTFIKQVNKTFGGSIIYLNSTFLDICKPNLEKWLGFDDSFSDKKTLLDQFIKAVSVPLSQNNPQIMLTAGKDSRAILSAALQTKIPFSTMTGTPPTTAKIDKEIPAKISKILGINHYMIDKSKNKIANLNEMLDQLTLETNSEFSPRKWFNFYKEYVMENFQLSNIFRIMGYGGEIYSGFYQDVEGKILKKTFFLMHNVRARVIEKALQRFKDCQNLSKVNASDLFYQRERDHFWVGANIRAMTNYTKILTPFKDPQLLALGYRFKGGIRKSNLHNHILQMLPVEIKKIPINGYYAINLFNHAKGKLFSKKHLDLSLSPDYLKEHINFELFNNIIDRDTINMMVSKYSRQGIYDEILHKICAVSLFFDTLKK